MHDEEILIRLVASALVYLGLLKFSPNAARVWLCAGGALAGAKMFPEPGPGAGDATEGALKLVPEAVICGNDVTGSVG